MGITNSNKVLSADRIDCDGSLKVTLALTAAPDIVTNPTDIALVLDRSGSMTGTPLANMKLVRKPLSISSPSPPADSHPVKSDPAVISELSASPTLLRRTPR